MTKDKLNAVIIVALIIASGIAGAIGGYTEYSNILAALGWFLIGLFIPVISVTPLIVWVMAAEYGQLVAMRKRGVSIATIQDTTDFNLSNWKL